MATTRFDLSGMTALVTGGGSGLGYAMARGLAEAGARVLLNGRRKDKLDDAAAAFTRDGLAAGIVPFDVTRSAEVTAGIAAAEARYGAIDILVNNAGIVRDKTLVKMEEADFDSVIAVHLKGSFNCTRHAAPLMKDAGYGRIINITSSAGLRGNFGQTNYGAAKAGLMGMTFVWALELGKYGITVNAVAPSGATRMTASLFEKSGEAPPPEENPALNAPLVAYLASEAAGHVNGQILGRTEYGYTLFQQPKQIAWMWKDGGFSPGEVADHFDRILGQHLQPVGMVMPKSMERK